MDLVCAVVIFALAMSAACSRSGRTQRSASPPADCKGQAHGAALGVEPFERKLGRPNLKFAANPPSTTGGIRQSVAEVAVAIGRRAPLKQRLETRGGGEIRGLRFA
jgi:hypothetical protein